jgi:integrase
VVYARWQWAWTIARAYIETRPPSGPVFAELSEWDMRQALKAALKVAGIEDYTPHDWRHTWAVQALKDEVILNDVATQLGHSDPVMTLRVYGRSRPRAKDFRGKGKK